MNDELLAVEELALFKLAGGSTVVELTNHGLRRNARALRRISAETGVHVIMGCGWYRQKNYPPDFDRRQVGELASEMVNDLTVGVDGSGIKAGIIGEIGVTLDYITPGEERVLRAAAQAHRKTGAAIYTHGEFYPIGLAQLDVLEEEGVDLRRVIVGHMDSYLNLDYHEAVARRGAYLAYDAVGRAHIYPDDRRVAMLQEMLRRGYGAQLLLSTDRCWRSDLRAYGGAGYDYMIRSFLPRLKQAGVSDEQIERICVINPSRVLPIDVG
jgi:phosphotriesterase-related protein